MAEAAIAVKDVTLTTAVKRPLGAGGVGDVGGVGLTPPDDWEGLVGPPEQAETRRRTTRNRAYRKGASVNAIRRQSLSPHRLRALIRIRLPPLATRS
jgi:hypothetical protein